jgi:hypothetical protein
VLSVQQDGGQAQVKVRYQYEDDEAFIGKFILQKFGSAWRIVEIVRGGTCDFCQKGGLRTAMYAVLRSYPDAAAEACRSRYMPMKYVMFYEMAPEGMAKAQANLPAHQQHP